MFATETTIVATIRMKTQKLGAFVVNFEILLIDVIDVVTPFFLSQKMSPALRSSSNATVTFA